MADSFLEEIDRVRRIEAVPTILQVVCSTTRMGFAAVARVTGDRWIACSILDKIDFGLKPGGELQVETTICHEIQQTRELVVIDNVAEDPIWCNHKTPALYGFKSYISVPIILADGSLFRTLCAIDPRPAQLRNSDVIGMFRLFADLIAKHLDVDRKLATTESDLSDERAASQLREQFLAILGHDLRTPMRAITSFSELMLGKPLDEELAEIATIIRDSAIRMNGLIDNILDLARGRLGGGLTVIRDANHPLTPILEEVIGEVRASYPAATLKVELNITEPVDCDRGRIAQLLANLLSNALQYGATDEPIFVQASTEAGIFELSIRNAGVPIPETALPHLFEPFFRSTISGVREGLGLGLYIAKEIAQAHGGTLGVSSTEGETRFVFQMPLMPGRERTERTIFLENPNP